jgi:ArsR family transcriptional regulator
MNDDLCAQPCVAPPEKVAPLRGSLLDVAGLSELFKALADETRVNILYLLSQQELCVCDLAFVLEMSMPAVSHHLRLLKVLRLVRSRKEGKLVFYTLEDGHVLALIEQARVHYIEQR